MMDAFTNAAQHARKDCTLCRGTGTYKYDHNHGTICHLCCQHNMGWWQLGKYHSQPGKWCCRAGCGHVIDAPPEHQ